MSPRLVELFAGTRSIGRAAESLGWDVWSTDLYAFEGIDHVGDVLELELDQIPWIPDAVWASPPCTTFSVASIGHHWTGGARAYVPKTEAAVVGMEIVRSTLDLIDRLAILNPELFWYVENPRGVLRKLDLMRGLPRRATVTYCQYGDDRMKPTDIWTNDRAWDPRSVCRNGDPCHVRAPRGARTGTQGRKNDVERSRIPSSLCYEVLLSAERQIVARDRGRLV